MKWYLLAFKNYANFTGRARRREYWMFVLINALILLPFRVASMILRANIPAQRTAALVLLVILVVYGLGSFIPALALMVRRMHDINKSGAWVMLGFGAVILDLLVLYARGGLFLSLIALALAIWMLVLECTDGTYGPNQYGDDPKERQIASSNDYTNTAS